ncbi:hypothetical protein HK105_203524 [Polyrhizophydium stewartii]|uniref:BLOC-1-related complex subunit 6 C-terminal helix domain-containing protein n=1 Tax=Polyrhizophydium stewartii TaxID=2732419 RepID=A0ABR4NB27_9FUNG
MWPFGGTAAAGVPAPATGSAAARTPGARTGTPGLETPLLKERAFSVPLEPAMLDEIEKQAEAIGAELDGLITALSGRLYEASGRMDCARVSGHTLQSVQLHQHAVDRLCEAVDENIFRTSQLVRQVDEISQDMASVQRLAQQIQDIKASLDWLEDVKELVVHTGAHIAAIPWASK